MIVLTVVAGFVMLGCHEPPQAVFVDLSQLNPRTLLQKQGPKPPSVLRSQLQGNTVSIEALPNQAILSDRRLEISELRSKLKEENDKAIQLIASRLKDVYLIDVEDFFRREFEALGPKNAEYVQRFIRDYRAEFDKYAARRIDPLVRLSLYLPVPTIDQKIDVESEDLPEPIRRERIAAREYQRQLRKIEDDFALAIQQLESNLSDDFARETERLNQRVIEKTKDAEKRALDEAKLQVRSFSQEVEGSMIVAPNMTLSTRAGAIQPAPAPFQSQLKIESDSEISQMNIQKISDDLQIWLKINHYQLISERDRKAGRGIDRTKDFVMWRQKFGRTAERAKS